MNVVAFTPQKPLPHSVEAEQALLGACLNNGEAIDIAARILKADDFHDPVHAKTWSVLLTMRESGRATTPSLVAAALGGNAREEISPGLTLGAYVSKLMTEAVTVINARDYANAVLVTSSQRRIIRAANAAADAAYAGDIGVSTREIAAQAIEDFDAIASAGASEHQQAASLAKGATSAVKRAKAISEGKAKAYEISWGIRSLNAKTVGIEAGDLIIIGGRPGMGKTTLGLAVGLGAAKQSQDVLFFSLEMTNEQLGQRAVAWHCRAFSGMYDHPISYQDIRAGRVNQVGVYDRLELAEEYLETLPFHVEQEAGLTMGQISVRGRRYKEHLARQGRKLKILMVDHLGLIRMSDRYRGNRVQEVSEVTAALKVLAKELDCAVIALCQLSRATEAREDKRPVLGDFRDSGSIEQDADIVVSVYRESYYLSKHVGDDPVKQARLEEVQFIMEAGFLKQRQGETGVVRLHCEVGSNYITDIEEGR